MQATGRVAAIGRGIRTLAGRPLPTTGNGAAVLAYHGVRWGAHTTYDVSPSDLRRQLEALLSWGLDAVPLETIVAAVARGGELDGLVAVTFDDGLADFADHAIAILADLDVPATMFVVADAIGRVATFAEDPHQQTLSSSQLRELASAGIEIGSHAATHCNLTVLDDHVLGAELRRARERLASVVERDVAALAYPYGEHDARVRAAARHAGYRSGCGFRFGRVTATSDVFALPRFCMTSRHTDARLAYQLARSPSSWEAAQPAAFDTA